MVSERGKNAKASETVAINARVQAMRKEGKEVISFGIGEPDFNTPESIKLEAKKALDENFTKYTPSAGIPELRDAICRKLSAENNLGYSRENIVVCSGAKHVLYNAMLALLNPGEEIIVHSPYWVSYLEMAKLAGAKARVVGTDESFGLRAGDVEDVVTGKTKAILLNSPCNPTGAVIEDKELERIAEIAVGKNINVISDEVYEKFIYDGRQHKSIAEFGDEIKKLTVVVNGVSKTYAMTGWRIGYCAADEAVASAISNIQGQAASAPNSIAQKAAVEALNGRQDSVKAMVNEFDRRRKRIVKLANEISGFECSLPEGAFYIFPNVERLLQGKIKTPTELAMHLLEKANVAVVPGEPFGSEKHIRISYASSMDDIEKGMQRIAKAVKELE